MKRVFCALLALTLAAAVLCACGGKSSKTDNPTALEGKWRCTEIPSSLSDFDSLLLEFDGSSFTYTMKSKETSNVRKGHCKETGEKQLVLYVDKYMQTETVSGKVLHERAVEGSESENQPVYAKADSDKKLTLSANGMNLSFEKMD